MRRGHGVGFGRARVADGVTVALVGLNFGSRWIRAYHENPRVRELVLCDASGETLDRVAAEHGSARRMSSLEEVLADPDVDAVHLFTPLETHAAHSVAVLDAGKHCAVAVPAALALNDLDEVVNREARTGLAYMMMETAAYTDAVVHVRNLVDRGVFGDISLARGEHHQDMTGWPASWRGFPPMWYATHALAPLLTVLGKRVSAVRCLGSGRVSESMAAAWGNPFPVEIAMFELEDSSTVLEVTRSLFRTVRPALETFSIYGAEHSFEWGRTEHEEALLHSWDHVTHGVRGRAVRSEGFADYISMRSKGRAFGTGDPLARLVEEFLGSIAEGRRPAIDAAVAAHWTAAGLAAHESALRGGERVPVER